VCYEQILIVGVQQTFHCTFTRVLLSGISETEWWAAGVLACGPADATAKGMIGFTFLVPAQPGSPGQRVAKRVSK